MVGWTQSGHHVFYRPCQRAGTPGAQDRVDNQVTPCRRPVQTQKFCVGGSGVYGDTVLYGQVHFRVYFGTGGDHVGNYVGAPTAQMPCCYQAVGAVVARADQHQHPLAGGAAHKSAGRFRHPQAGILHQGVGADALTLGFLLQRRHLGCGNDFHVDSREGGNDCAGASRSATTKATA